MQCHHRYVHDQFQPLNLIQDGGAAAILDLQQPAIYPKWFNRCLTNLAGPCIVTIDGGTAYILDLLNHITAMQR